MDTVATKHIPWPIRIARVLLVTALVLSVPLIGMQVSTEVNWSGSDFVVMGLLLITVGVLFELLLKKVRATRLRILFGLILFAALMYVWAEFAVGIFTNLGS